MRRPNLPYLEFKTVKGRQYIYFRKGKVRQRLPANPDSQEFSREYWSIRSGKRKSNSSYTWAALITSYYQSAKFKKLSPGTAQNYRRHCEEIRLKNGDKDVRMFRRKHAIEARDRLQDTWSKANERVAVLSILCRYAADLEWLEQNPVRDIEKLSGGSYEAWPEEKLRAFEQACDENGNRTARTVYELAIGTGQRLGDCIKMRWTDFDGEYVTVVQEKTGTKIEIFCPSRLREYLRKLPKQGSYILPRSLHAPMQKRAVQKSVEDIRSKIGVMEGSRRLVPHGWRYTAVKQLADAGVSDADIQAVTGHKTLAMVQKYRAQADQRIRSRRAQERRQGDQSE